MSGAAIVAYLLAQNSALTNTVPAANIKAGPISQKPALPVISCTKVSANQENTLEMGESDYVVSERVQVRVLASSQGQAQAIIKLVRGALSATPGTVNGVVCQSILPDLEGPDFFDQQAQMHQQSQDFMVWFVR